MTKKIEVHFKDSTFTLISDDAERFFLDSFYRQYGEKEDKSPNIWKRNIGQDAIDELKQKVGKYSILVAKKDKHVDSIIATKEYVLLYTKWLDPEYHSAVLEAFSK